MKIHIFKENGEVKYEYEYIPTPLGTEEEKNQVESFIQNFIQDRIISEDDLGYYEYEILGFDHFSIEKCEEVL